MIFSLVVPRIIQKCPLMMDGQQLKVESMVPKVTALAVQGETEPDKVKSCYCVQQHCIINRIILRKVDPTLTRHLHMFIQVLLKGVSSKASTDDVRAYVAGSGCTVKTLVYGMEPGVVLVKFNGTVGKLKIGSNV